jgi:hypothetical protein
MIVFRGILLAEGVYGEAGQNPSPRRDRLADNEEIVAGPTSESFACGVSQRYASVRFLGRGAASWPFARLVLEEDAFVFGFRPFFLAWGRPSRVRYEAVSAAGFRGAFPPHIWIRLADPSKGVIWITTPNEGVVKLADRLEQRGVPVRNEDASIGQDLRDFLS